MCGAFDYNASWSGERDSCGGEGGSEGRWECEIEWMMMVGWCVKKKPTTTT